MLSLICRTLSMGAYDRYRLDANNRVRTDAELAEYVEDRVRKTAEYQRDHYDFWYKILSPESKGQALPFGSGL